MACEISSFDEWFEAQGYIEDDGCYQEKYLSARDAWLTQEERLAEVIERLENYPCCLSCYLKKEEMLAARRMKERFIEILREELL